MRDLYIPYEIVFEESGELGDSSSAPLPSLWKNTGFAMT